MSITKSGLIESVFQTLGSDIRDEAVKEGLPTLLSEDTTSEAPKKPLLSGVDEKDSILKEVNAWIEKRHKDKIVEASLNTKATASLDRAIASEMGTIDQPLQSLLKSKGVKTRYEVA